MSRGTGLCLMRNVIALDTETGAAYHYSYGPDAVDTGAQWASRSGMPLAVDIETEGLGADAYRVKVIAISDGYEGIVLNAHDSEHLELARELIAGASELLLHNSMYDFPPLIHIGAARLADVGKVTDTLVLAKLALPVSEVNTTRRGLSNLGERFLGHRIDYSAKDSFGNWAQIQGLRKGEAFKRAEYGMPIYMMYSAWDTILTYQLRPLLEAHALQHHTTHNFARYGADAEAFFHVLARESDVHRLALHRTCQGFVLDTDKYTVQLGALDTDIEDHDEIISSYSQTVGFEISPTNPNDIGRALRDLDALPSNYPMTTGGKISTAAANMEALTHPLAIAFMARKKLAKIRTFFEQSYDVANAIDGRIRPQVNVLGTVTGRASMSSPNFQQFPKGAREIIRADSGHELTSVDWSGIEPTLGILLSGDEAGLAAYTSGADLYQTAMDAAHVDRDTAKVVLLAMMYGQSAATLAKRLKLNEPPSEIHTATTLPETNTLEAGTAAAERIQKAVGDAMPKMRRLGLWSRVWAAAWHQAFTISGRIVEVPIANFDGSYRRAVHKAMNYTIQGSGYDLLAEAMATMWRQGMAPHFYLTIHDELVVSTEASKEVMDIMQRPPQRLTDLTGYAGNLRVDSEDLGTNWRKPE